MRKNNFKYMIYENLLNSSKIKQKSIYSKHFEKENLGKIENILECKWIFRLKFTLKN